MLVTQTIIKDQIMTMKNYYYYYFYFYITASRDIAAASQLKKYMFMSCYFLYLVNYSFRAQPHRCCELFWLIRALLIWKRQRSSAETPNIY